MHELGLCRNIAAIVCEHAGARKVRRIRLAVGPLAGIERSALVYCWDLVAGATSISGSKLEFIEAERDTFLIRDFECQETR